MRERGTVECRVKADQYRQKGDTIANPRNTRNRQKRTDRSSRRRRDCCATPTHIVTMICTRSRKFGTRPAYYVRPAFSDSRCLCSFREIHTQSLLLCALNLTRIYTHIFFSPPTLLSNERSIHYNSDISLLNANIIEFREIFKEPE